VNILEINRDIVHADGAGGAGTAFIRPERTFASVDELQEQLARDKKAANNL
jgi:FAD synthase